jgi:hypothetical protein
MGELWSKILRYGGTFVGGTVAGAGIYWLVTQGIPAYQEKTARRQAEIQAEIQSKYMEEFTKRQTEAMAEVIKKVLKKYKGDNQ